MSRGISGGKQKKKLPIRLKAVEFFSKQNDDLIVIQNERFKFRRVLNPRAYMQIHTSTVIQEGWMEFPTPPLPPRVFDLLQYFETILPSVERL